MIMIGLIFGGVVLFALGLLCGTKLNVQQLTDSEYHELLFVIARKCGGPLERVVLMKEAREFRDMEISNIEDCSAQLRSFLSELNIR